MFIRNSVFKNFYIFINTTNLISLSFKYSINFISLVMKKNGEGGIKHNTEGKERKKRLN